MSKELHGKCGILERPICRRGQEWSKLFGDKVMWKCRLFGHKPGSERATYGYFGPAGRPSTEFWYIIQSCERCGLILKVLWPPKEEVLKHPGIFGD